MKKIQLSQGKVAIVDDDDFEWLSEWKWYAHKHWNTFYVWRSTNTKLGEKRKTIQMHRLILGLQRGDGKIVDHINHNGLDNRKCNLRIVTNSQNCMNQRPAKNFSSKYKGVSWRTSRKKWRAQIKLNKKTIYLGGFNSEEDAARAYNRKAIELFGEYAFLNDLD